MTGDNQERLVGVGVAAMVVGPVLVTRFGAPHLLVHQAVAITAVVVALLGAGLAVRGWRRILTADRPTRLALALYGAAAVQGALVALARGNEPTLIAGQVLAMSLLPLGGAAALGLLPRGEWRPFAIGFVAAVGVAGAIQLAMTLPTAINGPPGFRLLLPTGGSLAGSALLGLFLAGALTRAGRPWTRALAWAAGAVMLALIVGTGIRSQWLVLPAGIAAYALLAAGRARLFSARTLAIVGPVILVLSVGAAAATWWWFRSRPAIVPEPPAAAVVEPGAPILFALPIATRGAIRIEGALTCRAPGYAYVTVGGGPSSPDAPAGTTRQIGVAGAVAASFQMVLTPRPGERTVVLQLLDPDHLGCTASRLRAEELRPAALARFGERVAALLHRPPDPGAGTAPEAFAQDASIAFRLRETSAIASEIRRAAWPVWMLGRGLGARYAIETLGYDSHGQVERFANPNYIHNFYLFLPFKLGLLGSVEVLVALGIFVRTAARGARERPPGAADRHFFAAAAAAWITYILWSAAAPEILDFRLAAVWGMLAATTAGALERKDVRPAGT